MRRVQLATCTRPGWSGRNGSGGNSPHEGKRAVTMSPEQLTHLLSGRLAAAEIVEAIDNPELQNRRGWDLSGWRYEPVPWGVRFLFRDPGSDEEAEIIAQVRAV